MRRLRFSMATLMLAVPFFAVTAAAFRFTSDVWSSLLGALVILILCTAGAAAIYCNGTRRGFWVGVTLFGGVYWIVAHGPWGNNYTLSASVAASLYVWIAPRVGISPTTPTLVGQHVLDVLRSVCDSWVTLVFGSAGGFITQYIATNNAKRSIHQVDTP